MQHPDGTMPEVVVLLVCANPLLVADEFLSGVLWEGHWTAVRLVEPRDNTHWVPHARDGVVANVFRLRPREVHILSGHLAHIVVHLPQIVQDYCVEAKVITVWLKAVDTLLI